MKTFRKRYASTAAVALLFFGSAVVAQRDQHASYRMALDKDGGVVVYLNDTTFTPGAVRTTDAREVCSETTKQFRHTTRAMKQEAYRSYGIEPDSKNYEIDHLLPLEIGGADVATNLWPQPYPQAHWKDQVEQWAHKELCSGHSNRSLREWQHAFADNWYALFLEMNNHGINPNDPIPARKWR